MTLAAFFVTGTALVIAAGCLVQAWRRRGRNQASWVALALAMISGGLAGPAGADGPSGPGFFGMVVLAAASVCLLPGPRCRRSPGRAPSSTRSFSRAPCSRSAGVR
jgi:peptidoglycan/LPS O-acetylase OafA/YrhL